MRPPSMPLVPRASAEQSLVCVDSLSSSLATRNLVDFKR